MEVHWRNSAVQSLIELENWRLTMDLPKIGKLLQKIINSYFNEQDFSLCIPGKIVFIDGLPVELRIVLLSVGKSDPYRVFYRLRSGNVEIYFVKHPRQKPLT
ncbi:hypothetical protein [Fredinandcohnia onubensis]|uniref:hypothetical protein n=1 Tax=Fredinandcohnia onubensis TaxID=1571209 RepID=UPI000C0BCF85|nr:hypothetical protein [Fredinandcohnia onubensis]